MKTILVKVTVKIPNKPSMTVIARYYSVKEALDLANEVFPNASNITAINLGERA